MRDPYGSPLSCPAPVRWHPVLSGKRLQEMGWALLALIALMSVARAQDPQPAMQPAAQPQRGGYFLTRQPQRRVVDVMPRQEGAKIVPRLMDRATPDNTNVIISISKQRVYLICENEVVIDSPISSGRRGHPTPTGEFRVMEKELNHFSNIYGNFVDRGGRVVRSGVSSRIDSAPSGTRFQGAPMKYFMRLTGEGVGMHIGILPGYPASHGCIRLPSDIAPLIYQRVRTGTSVRVEE
jgi:lipoprotein-anchoring transpeptidase ErfK/SrfK